MEGHAHILCVYLINLACVVRGDALIVEGHRLERLSSLYDHRLVRLIHRILAPQTGPSTRFGKGVAHGRSLAVGWILDTVDDDRQPLELQRSSVERAVE